MTTSTYEQQAIDFLIKTNTTLEAKFVRHGKHFSDDDDERDIYNITISRNNRSFSFDFGQSLNNSMKYKDKLNGNLYTSSGKGLNNNMKVIHHRFFKDSCTEIKGVKPTAYDILACLTKYEPGLFEDFCNELGYDTDSRKALKTYNAVRDEWLNVQKIWSDEEIEELREIQ